MSTHSLRPPILVGILAASALVQPARAQDRSTRSDTRIDTTFSIGRDATVDLGLITGNIVVTASSRGEIRINAYSEYVPLRFEHVGNTVRLTTEDRDHDWRDRRNGRVGEQRMDIVVPIGTRVTASSVSGTVSVRGTRGEVEANSVSGSVTVDDAVRRASLSTVSGRVQATGIDGDVRASGVSGSIEITDVAGEISAETVSGSVTMRDARSSRVHAQSVSGRLTYEGTISRDGRYEFQSHSGGIRLLVPENTGATLRAQTFSGAVHSTLEMQLGPSRSPGRRGNEIELTLGGGGARIEAQTFSGNIDIDRASRRPDRE